MAATTAGTTPLFDTKTRSAANRRRPLWNVVAVLFALVWVFPIYWMVNSALMPEDRLRSSPPLLAPIHPTLRAFDQVVHSQQFWTAMGFSLSVTLLSVAVCVVAALFGAVALSRFSFIGRRGVLIAVLVVQMVPAEALFISQYRMLDGWGLLNSVPGLSLLYMGMIVPFTLWMLKGFVDGVPAELEEAAMVDGCSRFTAFTRVTLPLLGPGLVATGVFGFLVAWNEYTLAFIVLASGDRMTLPVWLKTFSSNLQETDWAGVMAGSTLIAVPVLVVFILVQNAMTKGMVAGAVKG
ncbi:carbohydrate ABC transporter permease [Kineococcus aurantiacus]|uniref:N,N'-diacetylchitobiose transport system permease protein n=1 Tax=Kineococcus aurantiacus TaxID=37633 RepID=A0A7Y9DN62_9ACTN|nr:carbohydrate ABC transporter permease [Kineococcus aurantiacus]NYD23608.1 N,N'-diacetylchitobiose transport system permease protein [Kineococcus aurantiacus]